MSTFTALILVCSKALTPDVAQCTQETAIQLVGLPGPFASLAECRRMAQQVGVPSLPQVVTNSEDYIRVLCVPK